MGQKIRDLSGFKIANEHIAIEYNEGWAKDKIDIHVQGSKIRYCCSSENFMELLSIIICAKRKLDSVKSVKDEMGE